MGIHVHVPSLEMRSGIKRYELVHTYRYTPDHRIVPVMSENDNGMD